MYGNVVEHALKRLLEAHFLDKLGRFLGDPDGNVVAIIMATLVVNSIRARSQQIAIIADEPNLSIDIVAGDAIDTISFRH